MSNTVITIARQYGSGRTYRRQNAGKASGHSLLRQGDYFARFRRKRHFIPLCSRMRKKSTALCVRSLPAASKMPPRFPRKAQVLQRMTTFFAIRQKSSASSQRKAPALSSDAAPTISLQMFQALSVSLSTRPKIFVCRKQ